ncbi:MAG: PASTA domain-containing protein [bacterium]
MLKKISKIFINLTWFFPFIAFFIGYILCFFVFQFRTKAIPNLIGKNLHQAMLNSSSNRFSLRLLNEKEDDLLPEGTIIQQIPKPYQFARLNQSIFVTIAKKPQPFCTPDFLGKKTLSITPELTKNGISSKTISLSPRIESETKSKENPSCQTCIAQSPQYGEPLINKKMTLYISEKTPNLYITPNFKGLALNAIQELLEPMKNVDCETYDTSGFSVPLATSGYKILDQKPTAGTIVDLSKPLNIQLLVTIA